MTCKRERERGEKLTISIVKLMLEFWINVRLCFKMTDFMNLIKQMARCCSAFYIPSSYCMQCKIYTVQANVQHTALCVCVGLPRLCCSVEKIFMHENAQRSPGGDMIEMPGVVWLLC